jgi:formylglycine-generating enzyme required for sulfatase activity
MHNGQGSSSTETGVYNLNGATSGVFTAQSNATIWLPTESEWYKAAYYDPTRNSGAGGYWMYANQSDSMTSNDITVAGAANYYDGDYAVTQSGSVSDNQNYLTEVGVYGTDSGSFYGTNDQSGNLFEWNDAIDSGELRGLRGGSWGSGGAGSSMSDLNSLNRGGHLPSFENDHLGFRVAGIPEPRSVSLTILAIGMLFCRRRRSPMTHGGFMP